MVILAVPLVVRSAWLRLAAGDLMTSEQEKGTLGLIIAFVIMIVTAPIWWPVSWVLKHLKREQ